MPELLTSSPRRAVNIHDVAAALGMHKSTVSLALSGKGNVSLKTRARVLEVATAMGYEPNPLAQRLANGASSSLVCLCSGGLDVGIGTEKILLIQKKLGQLALEVPIYTFADRAEQNVPSQAAQLRGLCRQQPRAIICASQALNPVVFSELERYGREGGIVVSYDSAIPLDCDQVIFDREDNAYQGARYLIERGHTRIGLAISVASHWPTADATHPQNIRVAGFKRALAEAGLPWRDEWMFRHSLYEAGGAQLAQQFLATNPRPTALCIVNDYVSLAFMVEVARQGIRIPEDISIIGHDNQAVASYCPVPLTSISQPIEKVADSVAQLLEMRLQGDESPARKLIVRGELFERSSVISL
jgi:DNA-binding LacI/PurR family transcriptional regulator